MKTTKRSDLTCNIMQVIGPNESLDPDPMTIAGTRALVQMFYVLKTGYRPDSYPSFNPGNLGFSVNTTPLVIDLEHTLPLE